MRLARMIQAVDAHACGEPGRVIVGGVLDVPGSTMFEKMQYLQKNADGLRNLMLREPRGYPAANCNLILPPTCPEAAAGYVIMEQTEYPGMSGTNTICVTTVLLETGMVTMREPVTELTLESPAGLIRVHAECAADEPESPCQKCRHRLDRQARLESSGHVDRRHRSFALRHRHLRHDGRTVRQGQATSQ